MGLSAVGDIAVKDEIVGAGHSAGFVVHRVYKAEFGVGIVNKVFGAGDVGVFGIHGGGGGGEGEVFVVVILLHVFYADVGGANVPFYGASLDPYEEKINGNLITFFLEKMIN